MLHLIRHAKPAASWSEDVDPGLDALGHEQAALAAREVASGPHMPIYSSPLRRCRETAAPLAQIWRCTTQTLPQVAEIPSPPMPLAERRDWLLGAMRGTWRQLSASAPPDWPDYAAWRGELIETLLALPHECVVFTHFIAINAAVGAATGDDRLVCFKPDHASRTVIDVSRGELRLVELGRQADTLVMAGDGTRRT